MPLRGLYAMHLDLLTPVLRIAHRVINTFLINQAHIKRREAVTGAITLIQRFGAAANLNIHLHALVLERSTAAAGACQGSCRLSHAANGCIGLPAECVLMMQSRSGLSVTSPMGDQLRVLPDQRAGFSSRALL